MLKIVRINEESDDIEMTYDKSFMDVNSSICVIQTMYGHDHRMVDVTSIVNNMKKPYFKVSNEIFGDPCEGIVKNLFVTFNGGRQHIYPEGCYINSLTYEIYHPSLMRATYGYDQYVIDVTHVVQQQHQIFTVCNDLFTDPCPGIVKTLTLIFDQGAQAYSEHTQVDPSLWVNTSNLHIYL